MVTDRPLIVACIPAYDEEGSIGSVVGALRHLDRVVVCNDGSGDLTGAIAEGLRAVVTLDGMAEGGRARALYHYCARVLNDAISCSRAMYEPKPCARICVVMFLNIVTGNFLRLKVNERLCVCSYGCVLCLREVFKFRKYLWNIHIVCRDGVVDMFTRDFLSRLCRRALRRGVWVRVLDGVERGILSLTCRLVDRVESEVLGVVLVKIVDKLREAMKSEFVRLMETYGLKRAREVVRLALKWGYGSSVDWARDLGFVRYLTILKADDNNMWGIL